MLRTLPVLGCWLVGSQLAAQVVWTNANPATAPSARKYTTMVWDSVRQHVVLFGGQEDLSTYHNDTWTWDGVRWTELQPARRPTQREDHMMAFDSLRGRAVVFGGHDVNVLFLDDTWEWDGTNWHATAPATRPRPAAYGAMAFDPTRGVVVLYGGLDQALVETGDTWEWDGTSWRARFPQNTPGVRSHHAMAWDPVLQRVVLYGGYTATGGWKNDCWTWNGVNWVRFNTGPGMMDMRMVYDTVRGRLVLWGGRLQPGNQSWELVNGQWVMRTASAPFPSWRQAHTLAFDERHGTMVLFGGYDDVVRYGETWLYRPLATASSQRFGHNCGSSIATSPNLDLASGQRPWLGETVTFLAGSVPTGETVVLMLGSSRTAWAGMALPLDLDLVGMTGCQLLVGAEAVLPMTNGGHQASLGLTLPNSPVLLGRSVYAQAAVHDPAANAIGFSLTAGLQLVLGGL